MKNEDTINLLKECNAGVKMGVDSIDDMLEHVKSKSLKEILNSSKEEHQKLGSQLHQMLNQYGETGKEPNPVAKGMSWMKTNMKIAMDDSDGTVADLTTDGCNMGVKSLKRYLNKYPAAEDASKEITHSLIRIEENLSHDVSPYL